MQCAGRDIKKHKSSLKGKSLWWSRVIVPQKYCVHTYLLGSSINDVRAKRVFCNPTPFVLKLILTTSPFPPSANVIHEWPIQHDLNRHPLGTTFLPYLGISARNFLQPTYAVAWRMLRMWQCREHRAYSTFCFITNWHNYIVLDFCFLHVCVNGSKKFWWTLTSS